MKKNLLLFCLLLCSFMAHADEGMWLLSKLDKKTSLMMQQLGLEMPVRQLYNDKSPSLKDAIVSFGGFCSGVVVSSDGLVFTNHHCGFEAIQSHSTVAHDYLKNGFVAAKRADELPNPDLFVSFLVKQENVTSKILRKVSSIKNERKRGAAIDSLRCLIEREVSDNDPSLRGVVDSYYGGNEYHLSIYKDYKDVRLVYAPPSSVGQFGGDSDNWVWPRHTGDFSVFRIYADDNNQPAHYSPDNKPYHPAYVPPVSLKGYKKGSYSMTLGYPGSTDRYLSSFGVEEQLTCRNQAMIDVRGIKQDIWKKAMKSNDSIRLMYASKYAESFNYWKFSIGINKAVPELKVLEKKRQMEDRMRLFINQKESRKKKYGNLIDSLQINYAARKNFSKSLAYFSECFTNASELLLLSIKSINIDFFNDSIAGKIAYDKLVHEYDNVNFGIDKTVMSAMLKEYKQQVDTTYLPDVYKTICTKYNGNIQTYVDSLYTHSAMVTPRGLKSIYERDSTFNFFADPAVSFAIDVVAKYVDMYHNNNNINLKIDRDERYYNEVVELMNADTSIYPDANSTMRLSFGVIAPYTNDKSFEPVFTTTTDGIFDKVNKHKGEDEYFVEPELLNLFAKKDFGKYGDGKGKMNVCFISNNDITGGNSGSAMFNAKGELIGLAFDGNWEGMSSNLAYESSLQRCIGVDIRYVLFIMEKYGNASHLVNELKLAK